MDGNLLPLPGSLRGGTASKVIGALLSRGFAEEVVIDDTRPADPALNTLWRNLDDCQGILVHITPAGFEAIGVVDHSAPVAATEAGTNAAPARDGSTAAESARQAAPTAGSGQTRAGTKQAQLIAMLERAEGATIEQIVAASGWQPHAVRSPAR